MFQSTHPHGVRLCYTWTNAKRPSFNPRTHMGCDLFRPCELLHNLRFNPRTHMGCDASPAPSGLFANVSIHAPTWGATYFQESGLVLPALFQSTHPHGVRHATEEYAEIYRRFNPRTHMGCDFKCYKLLHIIIGFQSTHPHGVRLFFIPLFLHVGSFNPRTHMGCDTI